jgi:uncharacterized protein (DUF2141 family)
MMRSGGKRTMTGRTMLPLGCLLAAAVPVMAEMASGELIVQLSGMTSDEGNLVYAMWSGPDGWLETNTVREGAVPVDAGRSTIRFENLPFGEYALSVYHDRNDNQKLDTGLFRIPKEPLGTSNDARIRFGPPKYEDAAFVLDRAELTIEITVRKLF